MPGHTKCCTCHAKSFHSKPEDPMLQNATLLRKSAPGPLNSSDEHVSCTAPATENASLQIFFKVHSPSPLPCETTSERPKVVRACGVFNILTSKCASRFDITTSRSGPELVCFVHFDFEMCFAPQRRSLFQHHYFQKCSGAAVFCTF